MNEIPLGAIFKKAPTPKEERIRSLAHRLWEAAGGPDGKSDYFWFEAEKQINAPPPERVTDYCCSICGMKAYFDGRCGDGPISRCCHNDSYLIASSSYHWGWGR